MSTANFRTMRNFPLMAKDTDIFTYRICPDCGECIGGTDEDCECCGAKLGDDYFFDHCASEMFCNDLQERLDDLNSDILFHKISIESGYYTGLQLYVSEENDPNEMDNEDTKYEFGLCRSVAIRKFEIEQRKIVRLLEEVADEFEFEEIVCVARFSNGEAMYEKATPRAVMVAAARECA